MNGTLEQAGSQWRLRFTRQLAADPDTVWRAITEPEQRSKWFPDKAVGDFTVVGAPLRFIHPGGEFDGAVLACDPPRLLEIRWGTDTIRFEIAAAGDGSLLTLLDTFAERGKAARDGAGWHVCLDNLERALAGREPVDAGSAWPGVHDRYVDAFGPEASTIGPPEDAQSG
jgi:uncharacterized protein YndB with AHSA1/START domain